MKRFTFRAYMTPQVVLVLLLAAFGIRAQRKDEAPIRVLVVTGGHDFERSPFFNMFGRFEGIVFKEAIHPSADSLLNPDLRRSFDAVVFYDMPAKTSEKTKTDFVKLLNAGIGIVFLHHSIASYQNGWEGFEAILGGKYNEKAGERDGKAVGASSYLEGVDVPVHVVDPRHPVTEGIDDFVLRDDEVYGNFEVLPGVHPLIETSHPKSTRTIGWWHTVGQSRVVYLQPGHGPAAYENPSYGRMVRQAIEWASGRRK
jgi:type 1 glutamine amidotransferase